MCVWSYNRCLKKTIWQKSVPTEDKNSDQSDYRSKHTQYGKGYQKNP